MGLYAIEACSDEIWELDALYVDPAYIGTGVGRLLLEHASNSVLNLGGCILRIQSDPNAEGFYLARGAERIGLRESGSIKDRYLPLLELKLVQARYECS